MLVAGVVLASEIAVRGASGLVEVAGFDETAFGMTVVGLVMSLEEVLLVLRPVQKQRISIAVGNLLYFPVLAGAILLVVGFLWVGRVGRLAAASLAALYVGYWVMAYR